MIAKIISQLFQKLVTHGYRDRAVYYTALSRFTNIALGPLMLAAVGGFLDPEQQGIYYVFGSLLQLRGVIDLGFGQSSLQLLASRYSNLTFSRANGVTGDTNTRDPFLDLAKFTLQMYVLIGSATLILIGVLGFFFLNNQLRGHDHIQWIGPWWLTIGAASCSLGSWGIITVAESANLLALTNRWRFWSELIAILGFLLTLAIGGGLWAMATMSVIRLCLIIPVIFGLGRPLVRQIFSADSKAVGFKKTILPLQSRTMVVWGVNFASLSAYNILGLKILGPASAGILGMSMQISNMIWAIALIWFNSKLSLIGNLAGANDHDSLKKLYRTGVSITATLWLILACCASFVTIVLQRFLPTVSDRIVSPLWMLLLIFGGGAYIWGHLRASYIRAFCVELFAPLAVFQGISTIVCVWIALDQWGLGGAASTYFTVMLVGAIWTELTYRNFIKNGNADDKHLPLRA